MKSKKPNTVSKRKMQEVDFGSMEEFLAYLPEEELKIAELLRKIVFYCIPDIEEKISYNVPYYKRYSNICYIWPGSVQWGNVKHTGVQFGFNKGYLIPDEINWLEKGNRKQVYWKTFYSVKEIDIDLLKAYIFEAVMIDEDDNRIKRKKK
jgi:Domain of unknown function (DU1801)